MASYGQSREARAPADRIWRIWSDTSTWPSWNPDVQEVKLDRPLGNGATGTVQTKSGGTHNIAIRDVEQGRSFVLQSDGVPATRLIFKCEAADSGNGSKISQTVTLQGPLSFVSDP